MHFWSVSGTWFTVYLLTAHCSLLTFHNSLLSVLCYFRCPAVTLVVLRSPLQGALMPLRSTHAALLACAQMSSLAFSSRFSWGSVSPLTWVGRPLPLFRSIFTSLLAVLALRGFTGCSLGVQSGAPFQLRCVGFSLQWLFLF